MTGDSGGKREANQEERGRQSGRREGGKSGRREGGKSGKREGANQGGEWEAIRRRMGGKSGKREGANQGGEREVNQGRERKRERDYSRTFRTSRKSNSPAT